MASTARPAPQKSPAGKAREGDSRFDRRLAGILEHATGVFYRKGYAGASMRDLSRATGMSLAGLYYYFESKEKLLYLIQKDAFTTIMERLRERLAGVTDAEQRVRVLIANHLEYSLANQKGMKVLSHEMGVLTGGMQEEIRAVRRQYYRLASELIDAVKAKRGIDVPTRVAVLSLFGMMNWIYTWHRPEVDGGAGELAQYMGDIFLGGLMNEPKREIMASAEPRKAAARRRRRASGKRGIG